MGSTTFNRLNRDLGSSALDYLAAFNDEEVDLFVVLENSREFQSIAKSLQSIVEIELPAVRWMNHDMNFETIEHGEPARIIENLCEEVANLLSIFASPFG